MNLLIKTSSTHLKLYCVLSFILLITLQTATRISCLQFISKCSSARSQEVDICGSRMAFLGDHSSRMPQNLTSASELCKQLKDSISCVQNFSRDCLNGLPKQLLTGLLKRGKQQASSICQDDNSKSLLIKKMSCLSGDRIHSFHQLMDSSIVRFEFIASKVDFDLRLPSLCCSYQIFNRDEELVMDKYCGGKPANYKGSSHEYVHKIVGGSTGEFINLICDGHKSLSECKSSPKTSNILPKLEEVTKRSFEGKAKPKNRSLLPALLEILDTSQGSR